MPASIRIATVRGIPVKVHFTLLLSFALLVGHFGVLGLPAGVLLFASVLLHELGHAVVAQRFGIRIAGIELHLLGGVALMTDTPKRPWQEVAIAAAGPAVSLAIGVIALALSGGSAGDGVLGPAHPLAWLGAINLGMAIFNLVPALPMDGGRIFRALLALRFGSYRGTRIATRVSRLFAALFVAAGLFGGQLTLALIGGLVFFLSAHELRMAELEEARRRAFAYGRVIWAPAHAPGGAGPVIDIGDARLR